MRNHGQRAQPCRLSEFRPALRVLCLIDSLGSGGAQRQLVTLAIGLKNRGHLVRFVTYRAEHHFLPLLEEAGIVPELVPPCSYPHRALSLRRLIRRGSQDVVLSFLDSPNLYAALAALPHRSWGLVVSDRSADPELSKGLKRYVRQTYRFADAVVCNSHTNRLMLQQAFPFLHDKVHTIFNAVDLNLFRPGRRSAVLGRAAPSEPLRVVVAASHQENKNLVNVARALLHLKDQGHGSAVVVDWYGESRADPRPLERAQEFIRDNGLDEVLRLHPETADIARCYEEADVVALFSFFEGLPNTICEGMAQGKPILLSNVCDASALVKDGSNGLLCDPSSPEDIAKRLWRLATMTSEERTAMGVESRARAESLFNEAAVLDHYELLLTAAARRAAQAVSIQWPAEVPASAHATVQRWTRDHRNTSAYPPRDEQ